MCTGAFLASGINVAVISRDNQAGIDWTADQKFLGVPESIRNQAIRQFAYLGLAKGRPYLGLPIVSLMGQVYQPTLTQLLQQLF